jgi:hypothetical protein
MSLTSSHARRRLTASNLQIGLPTLIFSTASKVPTVQLCFGCTLFRWGSLCSMKACQLAWSLAIVYIPVPSFCRPTRAGKAWLCAAWRYTERQDRDAREPSQESSGRASPADGPRGLLLPLERTPSAPHTVLASGFLFNVLNALPFPPPSPIPSAWACIRCLGVCPASCQLSPLLVKTPVSVLNRCTACAYHDCFVL